MMHVELFKSKSKCYKTYRVALDKVAYNKSRGNDITWTQINKLETASKLLLSRLNEIWDKTYTYYEDGAKGEVEFADAINTLVYGREIYWFNNLHLDSGEVARDGKAKYAQIDFVLLTRYGIIVVEVKNYEGDILRLSEPEDVDRYGKKPFEMGKLTLEKTYQQKRNKTPVKKIYSEEDCIKQNNFHAEVLSGYLPDIPNEQLISFSNRLKKVDLGVTYAISINGLHKFLTEYFERNVEPLSDEQMIRANRILTNCMKRLADPLVSNVRYPDYMYNVSPDRLLPLDTSVIDDLAKIESLAEEVKNQTKYWVAWWMKYKEPKHQQKAEARKKNEKIKRFKRQ